MAVVPYPSIDSGYIYDPGKKLDALISDFYEAEHAQSYLFKGGIISLPYILQQHPNDMDGVMNAIRTQLRSYLLKYFDDVVVEVGEDKSSTTSVSFNLILYIKVTQEGSSVDLYSRLKVTGTKLEESLAIRE